VLTLDAGDNDPIRFWRCVVATVDRVCTGLSDLVIPLLDPSQQATPEAVVTAVVNGLTADPREFWLILDGLSCSSSGPSPFTSAPACTTTSSFPEPTSR
jgi:ATP/maltotriose-dependent transcriptional regulator MalT